VAYSYVRYTGNGSTQNYVFPFSYINSSHIKVRLNGVLNTNFSFLNASTIQLTTAPASGVVIEIRRETPKDSPIVNFTDGSILLERDLDLLATFDTYVAQETQDKLDESITKDSLGVWNAASSRIGSVADPVNAQDAATKNYVDVGVLATITPSVNAAAASATAAAGSATAANTSKIAAESAKTAAESARDATLAAYDSFDDRYLGAKSSDPSVDNDGNPLVGGTLYFSTTLGSMRLYTGSTWVPSYVPGVASSVGFTPAGNVAATNVQAAIQELDSEKIATTAIGSTVQGFDANTAKTNVAQSFTAAQRGTVVTLTDGATITPDFAAANNFAVTLGGNRTLANPTNLVIGQSGVIKITQDATGSRTLAFGNAWDWAGGVVPSLTTTPNAVDILAYYVDGSNFITARLIGDRK
jgi:hypothetical protein